MKLKGGCFMLNNIIKALELGAGTENNNGVTFVHDGQTATLFITSMGRNTGEQEDSSNCYYHVEHLDYMNFAWWRTALAKATKLFPRPEQMQDPRLHHFYQEAAKNFYQPECAWVALLPPSLESLLTHFNAQMPSLQNIAQAMLPDASPVEIDDRVRQMREAMKDFLFEQTGQAYWFYDGSNMRVIPTDNRLAKKYQTVASDIISLLPDLEKHLQIMSYD
jgi:hypothetical protein